MLNDTDVCLCVLSDPGVRCKKTVQRRAQIREDQRFWCCNVLETLGLPTELLEIGVRVINETYHCFIHELLRASVHMEQ